MVAQLSQSYRKGNIAESLGIVLLQGVATVAPVPRTEDVGIDVVGTLLRPLKPNILVAENSFCVQFKAASSREVEFEERHLEWLFALELPLFIGSVDIASARIDLFACHRLTQAQIERLPLKQVILHLDSTNEADAPADSRRLFIGPPVHSWTVAQMAGNDFKNTSHDILKAHLDVAHRNIELGRCRRFEQLRWKTGELPTQGPICQMGGGPDNQSMQQIMNLAMPYLSACLLEFNGGGHDVLFQQLHELINEMCRLGAKRDQLVDQLAEMRRLHHSP